MIPSRRDGTLLWPSTHPRTTPAEADRVFDRLGELGPQIVGS
jgi:hypothetical protein